MARKRLENSDLATYIRRAESDSISSPLGKPEEGDAKVGPLPMKDRLHEITRWGMWRAFHQGREVERGHILQVASDLSSETYPLTVDYKAALLNSVPIEALQLLPEYDDFVKDDEGMQRRMEDDEVMSDAWRLKCALEEVEDNRPPSTETGT